MKQDDDLEQQLGMHEAPAQGEPRSVLASLVVGIFYFIGLMLVLAGGVCGMMNIFIAPDFLIATVPVFVVGLLILVPSSRFLSGTLGQPFSPFAKHFLTIVLLIALLLFLVGVFIEHYGPHFRIAG